MEIFQPRIYARHNGTGWHWSLVAEGNMCLTEARAEELLADLKKTDWWATKFDEKPEQSPDMMLHFGITTRELEQI